MGLFAYVGQKMDIQPKDINDLNPDTPDSGNLLQSILAVKKVWKAFMGFDVIYLTSNDRVRALQSHFKAKGEVKFPIAFMFETSVQYESELGLSAKNLARSGTGKGIEISGNSATISKSFLLPAKITFDFIILFDNDYEAIRWKERAILFLSASKLGATLKYKNFSYDLHQAEPVFEIATPQREPEQTPHPDASEYNLSLSFRTKIGNVKHVAKFNNEGLVGLQLNLMGTDGDGNETREVLDWQEGDESHRPTSTQHISRRDLHKAIKR